MADWQNLPDELLNTVAAKFTTISANIRFTGACRSWRVAGLPYRHRLTQRRQIPGLIFPPNGQRKLHLFPCKFIPVTEFINHDKKKKNINCKKIRDCRGSQGRNTNFEIPWRLGKKSVCVGWLKGWMLILDYDSKFRLQNPVTGLEFALPVQDSRLKRTENYRSYLWWGSRPDYRFSIWAPPPCSGSGHSVSVSDWFVSVVDPWKTRMRYCRVGDAKWVVVDFSECSLPSDIVDALWTEEGSLYVLMRTGELFCCEGPEKQEKRLVAHCYEQSDEQWIALKFLVEVEGEILLLLRRRAAPESDDRFEWRTSGFDVYRLDREWQRWVEITELGEFAVFIGFGQPFSVGAEPELGIKGNCIYFLDMEENRSDRKIWCDISVYDWKTSSIDFFHVDSEYKMPLGHEPVRMPIPIAPVSW